MGIWKIVYTTESGYEGEVEGFQQHFQIAVGWKYAGRYQCRRIGGLRPCDEGRVARAECGSHQTRILDSPGRKVKRV